jgi:hypothetical protein
MVVRTVHGGVSWLMIYPDAYEIGLPNQGLQILYEIVNERDDAWAERAYAPWTDMEAEMRRHGVPLFSVDAHRAAGEFDLLAFSTALTWPASRSGRRTGLRTTPWWSSAGIAPSTPSRSPTLSTCVCWATAKR